MHRKEGVMASAQPEQWNAPMPLICTPFEPGQLDAAIEAMPDNDYRTIARAEAAYFRGNADEACHLAEPFLPSSDLSLRISACFICGFANLSLDHVHAARTCLINLAASEEYLNEEHGDQERAAYMLFTASSRVLLHLKPPTTAKDFLKVGALLPEGLRLFATYALAHQAYLVGDYGRCIGMVENALAMKQERYPISEIFLHLVAAMGWMSERQPKKAEWHFMEAWHIAQPDGLIETIGEHHGLLQGLPEACLKKDCPREFARTIEITYRFSHGWRRVHNPAAHKTVADSLTTTEFAVSMLACRGWSNDEIAAHMGISRGTVKNRLSKVYAKLGIASRSELKDFMLS